MGYEKLRKRFSDALLGSDFDGDDDRGDSRGALHCLAFRGQSMGGFD